MKKAALLLSMAGLLTACSQMKTPTAEDIASREPSAYETPEDKNPLVGHGILNFHLTNMGSSPDTNMYDTNQNPNSYRNLTTQRFTISDDQNKIREAVKDSSGITPQFVTINGSDAWVHVNVPRDMTKKEREKLRGKIKRSIQQSVPRYHIHVRFDGR